MISTFSEKVATETQKELNWSTFSLNLTLILLLLNINGVYTYLQVRPSLPHFDPLTPDSPPYKPHEVPLPFNPVHVPYYNSTHWTVTITGAYYNMVHDYLMKYFADSVVSRDLQLIDDHN